MEKVIRLQFHTICVISASEYEAIKRDLEIRHMVGDTHPGDHILARLLYDASYRYNEIKYG